jgi:hypothetical protein
MIHLAEDIALNTDPVYDRLSVNSYDFPDIWSKLERTSETEITLSFVDQEKQSLVNVPNGVEVSVWEPDLNETRSQQRTQPGSYKLKPEKMYYVFYNCKYHYRIMPSMHYGPEKSKPKYVANIVKYVEN